MTLSPGQRPTCKVWTASYGGGHSVIIRARADRQDNYTVLDVNEGSEKREAAAYIAAYAKGGEIDWRIQQSVEGARQSL